MNHKNLYKHANRTWHNPDGAKGKGYAEKRPAEDIEPTITCPACNKVDYLTAWEFIHDDQGKGYFCPNCGERFTWTEVAEYNSEN